MEMGMKSKGEKMTKKHNRLKNGRWTKWTM